MQPHTFRNSMGNTVISRIDYQWINPFQRARGRSGQTGSFMYEQSRRLNVMSTQYDQAYLQAQANRGLVQYNPEDPNYLAVKEHYEENGSRSAAWRWSQEASLGFEDDMGKTTSEVNSALSVTAPSFQEGLDNMVGLLVNDPDATMYVYGFASPKETNISGEMNNTSKENNVILAGLRADAGKAFVLQYALEKYGVTLDPSRIVSTNVGITSRNGENDSQEDRKIVFKTTP